MDNELVKKNSGNNVQKLYDMFAKSTDPKIIIDTAREIKKHFTNVWGQKPSDETGEEFLYIIGSKHETFEWLLLLIILDLNGVGYREYFTALSNRVDLISVERCKWANLILKEIRSQMDYIYTKYCNDLIIIFDRVIDKDKVGEEYIELKAKVTLKNDIKNKMDVIIEYISIFLTIICTLIIAYMYVPGGSDSNFIQKVLSGLPIFILLFLGIGGLVWLVSYMLIYGFGFLFLNLNKEYKEGKIAERIVYQYEKALQEEEKVLQEEKQKRLRVDREFWKNLNGLEFEKEISKLFERKGYKSRLTKAGGDNGIDIFLEKDGSKIIVQCKAHKSPISPSAIRDFYGTLTDYKKANYGIFVSVSGFTIGAKEFAWNKPIELIDLDK